MKSKIHPTPRSKKVPSSSAFGTYLMFFKKRKVEEIYKMRFCFRLPEYVLNLLKLSPKNFLSQCFLPRSMGTMNRHWEVCNPPELHTVSLLYPWISHLNSTNRELLIFRKRKSCTCTEHATFFLLFPKQHSVTTIYIEFTLCYIV